MTTINNLYDKNITENLKKEMVGQEKASFIFNCNGGNIQNILEIADSIRKINHTTAVVKKAISAPFFLSILCDERFVEKNAVLEAHTGCLHFEEIAVVGDKIPQKALDNIHEYKRQLFSRLEEIGVDREAMSFLKYTGWLKRSAGWWIDKGIFLPASSRTL